MRSSINTALVCAMAILTAALYGCGGNDTGLTIAGPNDPGPSPVVATSHSVGNDMIDAANGTDATGGARSTGLVTRIGVTNGAGGIDSPAVLSTPSNSIVQSSQTQEPDANVNARWPASATAPSLSVDLQRQAFGAFRRILPGFVPIASTTPGNAIPDLGGKWHGEALQRRVSQGGTTVYTAVYSDIEKGGVEEVHQYYDFANVPLDSHGRPQSPSTTGVIEPDKVDLLLSTPAGQITYDPHDLGADRTGTVIFTPSIYPGTHFAARESEWTRPVPVGGHILAYRSDVKGRAIDEMGNLIRDEMGNPIDALYVANNEGELILHPDVIPATLICVNGRGHHDSCEGVQRDPDEGSLEGLWRFKRDADNTDKAYLSLGVWLSLPDYADGRSDVGAFADGSMPSARTALDKLTGTAKYEGPATGIWAKGVYERPRASTDGRPDDCDCPVVRDTQVGAFRAQARLWANFGTATDAPTVDGYVTDFTENDASLGNWFVQLNDAIPNDDATTLLNGNTSGEADGRLLQGQWGVRFFKRAPSEPDTWHPGYAAGTFSASTVDENTPLDLNALHIVGAFGTERQ